MMAIAQGVPALLQAGTGIGQFITGRKMLKDLERPEYEIPQAAKAALGQARSLASSQEMAGMSQAEARMNQQLAMGVQAAQQTAGSSAEALGAITNMFANRMAQQGGLAGQAAQDYAMRQAAVTQQLANMAGYQEKAQAYNVLQPYEEQAAAASAMGGAGMQNIMGGLQGIGGSVAGAYAQKAQLEQIEKMLGVTQGADKSIPDGIGAMDYTERISNADLADSLKSNMEPPGLMPTTVEQLIQQNTKKLLASLPQDVNIDYKGISTGSQGSSPGYSSEYDPNNPIQTLPAPAGFPTLSSTAGLMPYNPSSLTSTSGLGATITGATMMQNLMQNPYINPQAFNQAILGN